MAVKSRKAPAKKAAAKKPAAKKAAAPARKSSNTVKKGKAYECEVCGLAITVDEDCGCVEECDIICCGESMSPRKSRAKKTR